MNVKKKLKQQFLAEFNLVLFKHFQKQTFGKPASIKELWASHWQHDS
jgi:hypothetical protein